MGVPLLFQRTPDLKCLGLALEHVFISGANEKTVFQGMPVAHERIYENLMGDWAGTVK